MSMRCGFIALALDKPLPTPVLGTLPGAAERTRPPDDIVLARTRGEANGRRCDDDATAGAQQTQPRNDNRRAMGMRGFRFLLAADLSRGLNARQRRIATAPRCRRRGSRSWRRGWHADRRCR